MPVSITPKQGATFPAGLMHACMPNVGPGSARH